MRENDRERVRERKREKRQEKDSWINLFQLVWNVISDSIRHSF